jgi:rod shape determining protein RodA
MISISFLDFKKLKRYAVILYLINIFLLIWVLFFSVPVRGVHSWLSLGVFSFQPSELAKLSTILILAGYLSQRSIRLDRFIYLIPAFLITLIPAVLIVKQPDLGTALIFFPVMFIMLYMAGVKRSYLLAILLAGLLLVGITLFNVYIELKPESDIGIIKNIIIFLRNERYVFLSMVIISILILLVYRLFKNTIFSFPLKNSFLYLFCIFIGIITPFIGYNFLEDYQKKRLLVFLDPNIDPLGSGYNIIQSKITIGSGRIWGKGFLSGTQTKLGFLPERETDFMFSVIGEEFGLIGILVVIILYVIIISRGLYITYFSKDDFDFLVGIGIISLISVQMIVSIGVAIGIFPVTGLPLPLVSYGGSSLFVFMLGIGLLLGIRNQEY